MAGVFISYRREDSPGHAGRIFDRVRARFGADVVFMDVTAIDAGVDFVDAIDRAVGTCDVLLAIIGPQWAGVTDHAGRKRLDNPNDFIRLEIAGALKRNVRVVPVLVDDAQLPGAGDLPDDLQPLLRRNAAQLRDARWDADIEQLIASLERIVKPQEEPLRLEASPRGRLRWVAAVAVLALSVGAAVALWPRASAPLPARSATTTAPTTTAPVTTVPTTAAAAAPRASNAAPVVPGPSRGTAPPTPRAASPRREPPASAGRNDAPKEPPPVPDVVGRQLSEAREILRRAGVEVERVSYRDQPTQAEDLVITQSDANTSAGSPRAVVLTAVARAAVVIQHRPVDGILARRLASALAASGATSGLAVRFLQMEAVGPEGIARVFYGDAGLAGTAGTIAKDASAWLAQNDPGRSVLLAGFQSSVVSRTILIGLPDRGGSASSSASRAVPSVRGHSLTRAREMLQDAGFKDLATRWVDTPGRKPLEVLDQSEKAGRSGRQTVFLTVNPQGTLLISHVAADAAVAGRLASELRRSLIPRGVLVKLVEQAAIEPARMGRVASNRALAGEAASIATLVSNWLTKERGRSVTIPAATQSMDARQITFGLPSLQ